MRKYGLEEFMQNFEKNPVTCLSIVYFIAVLIKIVLSFQIPSPYIFFDETLYSEMARSFITEGKFLTCGTISSQYPPLYPIIISVAHIFNDITITYSTMKIINSFLSSLMIVPVYLISKCFLDSKKSMSIAIISLLLPAGFAYTFTVMSENLYYPLFTLSLFFMTKSITEDSKKWDILCGLSIGLVVLTKIIGLILLCVLVLALLTKALTHVHTMLPTFYKKWRIFLSFGIVIIPWLLRNAYHFGFTTRGLFGYSTIDDVVKVSTGHSGTPFFNIVYAAVIHVDYFIFSTGILFFALSIVLGWMILKKREVYDNKVLVTFSMLSWSSWIGLIVLCGIYNRSGFTVMGRYVDVILPAFLIMGMVSLDKYNQSNKFWSLSSALLICSAALYFTKLEGGFDAQSTTLLFIPPYLYKIGILSVEPNIKWICVASPFVFALIAKMSLLKWKFIVPIFLIFFMMTSTLSFYSAYTGSHAAYNTLTIGLWLHSNAQDDSIVIFDERDIDTGRCKWSWTRYGIEFWKNGWIKVGNITTKNADYIISSHKLDLPVMAVENSTKPLIKGNDTIYLYKSL